MRGTLELDRAVHLGDVATPGPLVKAVDVLRHDRDDVTRPLEPAIARWPSFGSASTSTRNRSE